MNILEIKDVSKKIGKRQILNNLSLEVKEGEIYGFVGPNGAGKTTLIKVMLGLYKNDSGSIKINGYDIKKDFEKAMDSVGAIIENPEVYSYMSGKDNIDLYLRMNPNNDKEYVNDVIKSVKLGNRINSKVKTYSLGMRQRLGIAQALVSRPKILILDEPTNGLDPLGIKELRELLRKISKEQNIAVFISSHILKEIEIICDRIAIIDNGSIIEVKDMNNSSFDVVDVLYEVSPIDKAKSLLDNNNISYKVDNNLLRVSISNDEIPNYNKLFVDNDILVYQIKKDIKSFEDEFIEVTSGTKGQIK